jgi:hypothetical protein
MTDKNTPEIDPAVNEIRETIRELYERGIPLRTVASTFGFYRDTLFQLAKDLNWEKPRRVYYKFDVSDWFHEGSLRNPRNPGIVIKRCCKDLVKRGWTHKQIYVQTGLLMRVIAKLVGQPKKQEPITEFVRPSQALEEKMRALLEQENLSNADYKNLARLSLSHYRAAQIEYAFKG